MSEPQTETELPADTPTLTSVAERIRARAAQAPQHLSFIQDERRLSYAELDARMDRVAVALQRAGIRPTQSIAICATNSIDYATLFLGAVRAAVAVAPLSPSSAPEALAMMAGDADARLFFIDEGVATLIAPIADQLKVPLIGLNGAIDAPLKASAFEDWLAPAGATPEPVVLQPEWPFNIIYSSGTTGAPKGIVQPFGMRSVQIQRGSSTLSGYSADSITLLSTPLYSNTTLVSFFSTLGNGGTVVLMAKFDVVNYLNLAQKRRVTHTMLVPVQYQRLMAHPDFDTFDLSSFVTKQSTSAPFAGSLKADVLRRWPGKLIDAYGMTEGGGTCVLEVHLYPDKLHTVGKPVAGHDIRLVGEDGREVPPGEMGEIVGHSPGMMVGYHKQPKKTSEAEWFAPDGKRFIRTGDVGRFDADGFLVLMDRKKDMIISGGFNLYPSDLEMELRKHEGIADVAVVGVASTRWGETPVAYVVPKRADLTADELLAWANQRLGKMQRLAAVELIDQLPRSPIGKVLKRELRDEFQRVHGALG